MTEVFVDDVYFVDSKGEIGANEKAAPDYSSADDYTDIPEGLPFT